jgi:hypothetical protein
MRRRNDRCGRDSAEAKDADVAQILKELGIPEVHYGIQEVDQGIPFPEDMDETTDDAKKVQP